MKYIWACSCGKHTECTREDQQVGAVWHCDECGKTFACVRPRKGGKVWISVAQGDIEFHGLLEEPEPPED
jgi:uncharacterized Zn finger protein